MAALNLTGTVHIAPLVFLRCRLGIVGLGLFVGTWFGRARGLIALGILLSLMLGAGHRERLERDRPRLVPPHRYGHVGPGQRRPAIQPSYRQGVGDATWICPQWTSRRPRGRRRSTSRSTSGRLRVIVPSNVDVTVDAEGRRRPGRVFRESWDGLGQTLAHRDRPRSGRAGGGQLRLTPMSTW
jgi:hypothetical protein